MANLLQFLPSRSVQPIGASRIFSDYENMVELEDGSVWVDSSLESYQIPFTNQYAHLANTSFAVGAQVFTGYGRRNSLQCVSFPFAGNIASSGSVILAFPGANYLARGGQYLRSTDNGASWAAHTLPVTESNFAIFFVNGFFIGVSQAGGTNRVIRSLDGLTWATASLSTAPGTTVENLLYNGTNYLICTDSGIASVFTSVDGLNFTARTLTARSLATEWFSPSKMFSTWAPSAGLFVLPSTGRIQTSPDGVTWTNRESAPGLPNFLSDISKGCVAVASPTRVLLLLSDRTYYYESVDAINWVRREYLGLANFSGKYGACTAVWDGTRFAVLFRSGAIAYSLNGIDWQLNQFAWTQGVSWKGVNWTSHVVGGKIFIVLPNNPAGNQPLGYTINDPTDLTPKTVLNNDFSFQRTVGPRPFTRIK